MAADGLAMQGLDKICLEHSSLNVRKVNERIEAETKWTFYR